jgi:Kef-type K+ transport system membrane component KefB
MEALAGLFVVFVLARLFGEGAERVGQPAAVGELLAGLLIGLALAAAVSLNGGPAGLATYVHLDSELIHLVAEAGIFFLLLSAGIDMKPTQIAAHSTTSFLVAAGGAVVPLATGTWLAWTFLPDTDMRAVQALFVGVALAITAIPTTVRVLAEMGLLSTRLGQTMVAAAIFDDVIGLVLLAVITALIATGEVPGVAEFAMMLLKAAAFFVVTGLLGAHVYPRISRQLHVLQIASAEFAILMGVALGYGVLAEVLGMHWIIGVFMAGLFFEPDRVGPRAYAEMKILTGGITAGFLGPVFFASIGLAVDLTAVVQTPVFLAALIGVAIAGKLVGAGVPARLLGFGSREAAAIGVGMSSRGAVELVVISIAVEHGLFAMGATDRVVAAMPSALVLMAIATTLIAPIALGMLLQAKKR